MALFRSTKSAWRALGVLALALPLAACDVAMNSMVAYYDLPPAERQEFIRQTFGEGKQIGAFISGEMILGTAALYVSFDEFRALIVDEESLFRYGLGLYLARFPTTTYEEITRQTTNLITGENFISREQFDFYRGWGMAYYDELRSRPENRYLVEREELFRKRVQPMEQEMKEIGIGPYLELIRDTDQFNELLTDDNFARNWLVRALDEPRPRRSGNWPGTLGPVQTPVSPGTGS